LQIKEFSWDREIEHYPSTADIETKNDARLHFKNPDITDEELQDALGVKQSRFYIFANQMKAEGLIKIAGRGDSKKYHVTK